MSSLKTYLFDVTDRLFSDTRVGNWCKLPYHNHPKGCPNFGIHNYCPPHAPSADDFFDLKQPHWFLITEFNLKSYIDLMREKHPKWSERRLKCLLYWQGSIRAMQRKFIANLRHDNSKLVFSLLPEAMNLNIFKTLIDCNIPFETKPKTKVLKVALLGYPNSTFTT